MRLKIILLIPLSVIFAIFIYSAVFNGPSIWNYGSAESNNNGANWAKFTSRGLSFEYPTNWNIEYPELNVVKFVNYSNPNNVFGIIFSGGNSTDISNDINNTLDKLNNHHSDSNYLAGPFKNSTIVEPFKEELIGDENAAMAKLRVSDPLIGHADALLNIVYLSHNGKLFSFFYANTPNEFDTNSSNQTRNHIFTSLEFTTPILNNVHLEG